MTQKVKITSQKHFDALHKNYITGTDLGAILGYNKYQTAYDVFTQKTNFVPIAENIPMQIGHYLEPLIADLFTKETGIELSKPSGKFGYFYYDDDYHIGGTPDRNCANEHSGLECKHTSFTISDIDSIPISHLLQCNTYMYLRGCDYWYLAYLTNNKFVWFLLIKDDALQQYIINTAKDFYNNHVKTNLPPEAQTVKDVLALYKDVSQEYKEVSTDEYGNYERLKELQQLEKSLKSDIDELKKQLILGMKEKQFASLDGRTLYTYKLYDKESFDLKRFRLEQPTLADEYVKKSQYRALRLKDNNE